MGKGSKIAIAIAATLAGVAVIAACGGSDGASGVNGTNGTQGTNGGTGVEGPAGPAGAIGATGAQGDAGLQGATLIISDRAKHGLAISPVAVNTNGLTADEVEQIGQGSYLVNAVGGCNDCHTTQETPPRFLGGGRGFVGNTIYARNLTPDATTGMKLTKDQFVQAIRTGADFASGATPTKTLSVMPWANYRWMSTPDIESIYAYLKAIPAVNNAVTADTKNPATPGAAPTSYTDGNQTPSTPLPPETDSAGKSIPDPDYVIRGAAIQPLNHDFVFTDATAEMRFGRGSYIVNSVGGCGGCHSNPEKAAGKIDAATYLAGGKVFAVPGTLQPTLKQVRTMSANLAGAGGFFATATFTQFLTTITQGVHGDSSASPQPRIGYPMPYDRYRLMTLEDLASVYTYLSTIASWGGVPGKAVQEYARYCAADGDCDTGNGESCNMTNHECVGKACAGLDANCDACQTCTTNACAAPAAGAACLTSGL